jgi:hypothetical protein
MPGAPKSKVKQNQYYGPFMQSGFMKAIVWKKNVQYLFEAVNGTA